MAIFSNFPLIFRGPGGEQLGGALGAYTELPGKIHTNPDGSQCVVYTPDYCLPLAPCDPGYYHSDAPGVNPISCVPRPGTDVCPLGTWRGPYSDDCWSVKFNPQVECVERVMIPEAPAPGVDLPLGTIVTWSPCGDNIVRLTGKVVSVDGEPTRIHWSTPSPENWAFVWEWLRTKYPADDDGFATGGNWPYPLPTVSLAMSVSPDRNLFNKPLRLEDEPRIQQLYLWTKGFMTPWLTSSDAKLKAHAQAVLSGRAPFAYFTNLSRTHLNQRDVTVNGQKGTLYNDKFGYYYGPETQNKLGIKNFSYWDKDFNAIIGLFPTTGQPWYEVLFPVISIADAYMTVVVNDILIPIAKELYDAIKAIGCALGSKEAAAGVATAAMGPSGAAVGPAVWAIICGNSSTPPPPGSNPLQVPWGWVGAGLATIVVGVGAVLLLKKKRRKK